MKQYVRSTANKGNCMVTMDAYIFQATDPDDVGHNIWLVHCLGGDGHRGYMHYQYL